MAAPGSVRSGCAGRRRASPADRGAAAVRGARYKRPFDLAVRAFGLVVLLPVWPVLIGAIALAVRLSGPGPVLYRQARLGRGGREFEILKFRTMAADAEARTGPVWAKPEDARPTPVGRVLRRRHLDELPQALNVLIDAGAVLGRAGTLGELFAGRAFDPPWWERHMARTGSLTSRHEDLFRAVTGHNLGISRAFFEAVGGFDESFARYGGEDTEFGYRVQMQGGLLAPARGAFAWHQGRWADGRQAKERDRALQRAKLAGLIADPGFRGAAPGRVHPVPRHVVTLEAGDVPAARAAAAVEALLADPAGDLAVRVELPPGRGGDGAAMLEERFRADPRVRVAPQCPALDAFPASPFHLTLPAGAAFGPGAVGAMRAALGDAVAAEAVLPDGARASIARAWVLHRARRGGLDPAAFGEVRRIPAAALRPRAGPGHPAPGAPAPGDPALGVEIAVLGARSRRVFAAASRVAHRLDGRPVDVVLADGAAEAADIDAPVVCLETHPALSVPAFDPAVHNPMGRVFEVEHRAAALGPRSLLPPGVRAHRKVAAGDPQGAGPHHRRGHRPPRRGRCPRGGRSPQRRRSSRGRRRGNRTIGNDGNEGRCGMGCARRCAGGSPRPAPSTRAAGATSFPVIGTTNDGNTVRNVPKVGGMAVGRRAVAGDRYRSSVPPKRNTGTARVPIPRPRVSVPRSRGAGPALSGTPTCGRS